jgi:hypothetical protein
MKTRSVIAALSCFASALALSALAPACSGGNPGSGFGSPGGGSGGSGSGGSGSGGSGSGSSSGSSPILGGSSSGGTSSSSGGQPVGVACPSGWDCNVSCPNKGTTSITGIVMDPMGVDPLYNIVAYVATTSLGTLPSGVLTGADKCSCSALFQGDPIVYATTNVDGKFTITNAPVGKDMTLVIQVGKWRTTKTVTTTSCGATDAGTISLPKNTKGSQYDSIPDIAVSTGGSDSLECLLARVGLDTTEYVPGWTQPGHVHIFNGGGTGGSGLGGGTGKTETNQMAGAPTGAGGLWDTTADLMKNDIVLLSCEGGETDSAIPQNLEDYLNVGGRAFASHFHYAWFNGSTAGGYSAPADWGSNLADWTGGVGTGGGGNNATVGGNVVSTLTGGGNFAKGAALEQWLSDRGALSTTIGTTTVASPELGIAEPRYNANVTNQKPSQSWIQLDTSTDSSGASSPTLYFSFDTPVNTPTPTDGGSAAYCGRAVFSGLHVGGASYDSVNCAAGGGGGGGFGGGQGCNTGHIAAAPPPGGCDTGHPLSPQEKALEFMLFDLSSCVVPDTIAPTTDAGTPIIPR